MQVTSGRRRGWTLRGVAAAGLALACCVTDPDHPPAAHLLEGSLQQVLDLGYDEARVVVAPEDVALLFVRLHTQVGVGDAGSVTSEDYPFKVSMAFWGRGLADAGVEEDLAETTDAGVQRGTFTREVVNDPYRTFPPAVRAGLRFDRVPVGGQTVTGAFHVTFKDGIDPASGRTVFGNFSAKVGQ